MKLNSLRFVADPMTGARPFPRICLLALTAMTLACLQASTALSQTTTPPRSGEAFVTRFSGVTTVSGPGGAPAAVVDPNGVVASMIDLRNPGQPPQGQHWVGEAQRLFVTAAETGQVFGVTFDDERSPNIYLSATAAFGLHRTADNGQWQPGMWGAGGGPGTIYKLGASTGFRAQPFAQVTLGGRANTGAALGNIAYDRWSRQLYVSDMETGMIHRIRTSDGTDLGFYDHGMRGRANFYDAVEGKQGALPPVAFDPASRSQIVDCPSGRFEHSPACWNVAANGRRVWGIGVWRNSATDEVRLYYATWSSPAFDPEGWLATGDNDKRNAVWSVGIAPDGSFNIGSVRREFLLPDFFVGTEDISRAGFSQPVSDIAFPVSAGLPLMLVAERGGLRNLGLGEPNAFAAPHEARVLRYELHDDGVWRPIGRYDIGFYDRIHEGEPRMRANSAGGASFGPGFNSRWSVNSSRPDNYVWATGDALCSPDGPCNLAAGIDVGAGDDSDVHGLQGVREDFYAEVAPAAAYGLAPEQQDSAGNTAAVGPDESYLIDVDVNLSPDGNPVPEEFARNDATLVGDIAVFQQIVVAPAAVAYPLPPAPPRVVPIADPAHDAAFSHARYGSHGQTQSHYRFASHSPAASHLRYGSHNEYWSHHHYASHNLKWSHNKYGSHGKKETHNKLGSHKPVASHFAKASKVHLAAASHKQFGSHNIKQSLNDKIKNPPKPKPPHSIAKSLADKGLKPKPKPPHTVVKSALDKDIKIPEPKPVHTLAKSALDKGVKIPEPKPVHTLVKSATDKGVKSPKPKPVHTLVKSAADKGVKSPKPKPVHNLAKSAADKDVKIPQPKPVHTPAKSALDKDVKLPKPKPKHNPGPSAIKDKVKAPKPAHSPAASIKDKAKPTHTPAASGVKPVVPPKAIAPRVTPAPKIVPRPKAATPPKPALQPKVVAPPKPVAPKVARPPKAAAPAKPSLKVQPAAKPAPARKAPAHNAEVSARAEAVKQLRSR